MNIPQPQQYPQGAPTPHTTFNPYAPQGAQSPFYSQSAFAPAGMVFLINSSQELNTIPLIAGLNLYWCAPENKVTLRNYTNGAIETKEYYLSPTQPNNQDQANQFGAGAMAGEDVSIPKELFKKLDTRLSTIETQIEKLTNPTNGGTPEWQL